MVGEVAVQALSTTVPMSSPLGSSNGNTIAGLSTEEPMLEYKEKQHIDSLNLSTNDEHTSFILVFDFPDISNANIQHAADHIKESLDIALRRFPLSTTDKLVSHKHVHHTNSASIPQETFEVSVCKTALSTASFQQLCSRGVLVTYLEEPIDSASKPRSDDDRVPACQLRTTFVRARGLFLTFRFPDARVDDASIHQFLRTFAAATRGELGRLSSDVLPKREAWVELDGGVAQKAHFPERDFDDGKPASMGSPQTVNRIFAISAEKVRGLQQAVERHIRFGQYAERIYPIDCLSALLWSTVLGARRRRLPLDTLTRFAMTVDARSEPGRPLSESSFGNVSVLAMAQSTVGDLLGVSSMSDGSEAMPSLYTGCLAQAALAIRRAVNAVDPDYAQQQLSTPAPVEDAREARDAITRALDMPNTGVRVRSQATLGADLKFGIPGIGGDGTPRWIRKPWISSEGDVVILPRRGGTEGDANWEFVVALEKDDMGCLVCLLERGWCTPPEELGGPELRA
ncbi:hypothetical protein F4779DRAFT_84558 [Xylariaceae sp. FL0662B]|nr:hypothetical protein F4779DRAFT_84558 [Xylariaceae sp. FL0662B]